MRKLRNLFATIFAILIGVSVVGCGGSNINNGELHDSNTVIYVANTGGGVGEAWLVQAAKRFQEQQAEVSYETNKKGVYIDVYSSTSVTTSTMSTDGYTMYFTEKSGTARSLSAAGLAYDLTNIVTEKVYDNGTKGVVDYIEESFLPAIKGADDHFYALPHFEIYPTLTYNRDIFDEYGIYFAAPDAVGAENYPSKFGDAKMVGVNGENVKKSCGIDGKYGTDDDGLPTSLVELLIMCDYMYTANGVVPFTVSGGHIDYYNYLSEGIISSIMGRDSFLGMFSFDTEVEVVTGYSEENLFYGIDYIKKPNTTKIQLTNENGYKTRESVARYYACAFAEIANKESWFSEDSTNGNSTHLVTQKNFILGGVRNKKEIGILIEGSQWVNESLSTLQFDDFNKFTNRESNLGIMPFPVSLNTTITEGNGKRHTVMDFGTSYMFVNKKIEGNSGVEKAVKDFIQFLYSQSELQNFTKASGVLKASMKYDYATTEITNTLTPLQQEIIRYRENGDMAYQTSSNPIFYRGWGDFVFSIVAPIFRGEYGDNVKVSDYLTAARTRKTTKQMFENFFIDESSWNNKYLTD